MKKVKIILPIIIMVLMIIMVMFAFEEDKEYKEYKSKKDIKFCNIDIDSEGNINVSESFEVYLNRPSNVYRNTGLYNMNLFFQYDIYKFIYEIDNLINEIKVTVDGKEIQSYSEILELQYNEKIMYDEDITKIDENIKYFKIYSEDITIYNLNYGNHVINLEYKVSQKIVEQYFNLSVLKLGNNNRFKEYKIKMNFPKELEIFKVDNNHAIISQISNDSYEIDMSDTSKIADKSYVEIRLDKDIFKAAKKINQEYNLINKINSGENFALTFLGILALSTIILFILVKLLTRRKLIYKNYIKSTKIVLDPIFAESLIDGKIGTKELIMSCIMDLVQRKNIQVLGDNETLKINNFDNITEYEKKIVDLIFDRRYIMSFKQLENKFNLNAAGTLKFCEKLEEIKEYITQSFFDEGIYSKIGEYILKIIKTFALINAFNFIPLTLSMVQSISKNHISLAIIIAVILGILIANIKTNRKTNMKLTNLTSEDEDLSDILFGGTILVTIGIISYIIVLITIFESNILMSMIAIIVLIVNILIVKKSKMHCLTNEGIIEYNKIYALKRYIEDYSLMKQREIDGIKIWDRYLAYACAFGISTKITKKIDEDVLKINNFFDKINIFY